MDDDQDKLLWQAVKDRDKAEDRAIIWKCIAIALFLLLGWSMLESRGCFGAHVEGWVGEP